MSNSNKKGNYKHGHARIGAATSEYRIWSQMKQRCILKTNHAYPHYGGRGIKVCDRWLESFQNFLEDMGNKPTISHTLERINVNGNYEPSNCKWATRREQRCNQRDARYVTYKGETKRLQDWCIELNLKYKVIWSRIYKKGISVKVAFETPLVNNPNLFKKTRLVTGFVNHSFGFIR